MDILKKAVVLVAILSISLFIVGCGGDDAADDADAGAPAESTGGNAAMEELIKDMDEEKAEE